MINWRKPTIYTLLYLNNSKIPSYLNSIKKFNKFSLEEQKKFQQEKLRNIILHAWKNVPYYHKILKEVNVVKGEEVYLENFNQIPILTKDVIKKKKDRLYSGDHKKRNSYKNTSGGSTGKPVEFLQDKKYNDWNMANKLYFFNNFLKKEIGEKEINLWGSERDIYKNSLSYKEKLINFLYNRTFLNAFQVSSDKLLEFVKIINKTKPVSMWVYVESIDILAKFVKNNKLKIHSPKFIISTAGVLYPEIRKNIENVFGCPVYNQYGSREVGAIAIECECKEGLHEFFWSNYIEIIDSKIYITNLNNYSMPLIRYNIGDTGVKAENYKCNCGRNNLFFQEIKGREINHFITAAGKLIHGQYFIHQFYFKSWIKKFQIIQRNYNSIEINIIGERNNKGMNKIENNIRLVMGDACKVIWNFVSEIEPTKSGKYLYTINKINNTL